MGHVTLTDIDELLYAQHLTPEGAKILRQKLRTRPKRKAKPVEVVPTEPVLSPLPDTFPQDFQDILDKLRREREDPLSLPAIVTAPWTMKSQPCIFDEFMKAYPQHTGPLGISCPCPRCSPRCLSSVSVSVSAAVH